MTTATHFNAEALRRGIELGDVEAMMSLYSDDTTLEIVDQTSPPTTPRILASKEEIRSFYDEISCRDMHHSLSQIVVEETGVAFLERCEYPGGPRVVVASTIELTDGLIDRQVMVQSWDA